MTEGEVTNAMVTKGNEGLKAFPHQAILECIDFVERKNADGGDYSMKNHVKPLESLKHHKLLNTDPIGLPADTFVRDGGSSLELLMQPDAKLNPCAEREVLAIRIVFRNGGYAFWASDADLQNAPCKDQGPGKTRMVARLVFRGDRPERNFVICETSEAMNRVTISAVRHNLLSGEVLGSPAWCRRVYDCGPDIFREPEVFRKELFDSLIGTGNLFEGEGGIDFGSTHEEQAQRPWFLILFATKNGFGFAGTAVRSEIVGCVFYELGYDVGARIEVFRGNRELAEDFANIIVCLAKDLGCFDHRYDPRQIDEACVATTRCQLMVCYQQAGHYQIGPKKGTVKKSDVHGRFWTPPITSCETAAVLREYGYEVLTPEGPAPENGGGPHSLYFGVASWATGKEREGYERVREPIPKPVPREKKGNGKPTKPGWRDRRKNKILSGEGYAAKTPRKEVPALKCEREGDLIGERIMVLWEEGSHPDVTEEALYYGLVQGFNAVEGTHHIIYDDFGQEDEHLAELQYMLKKEGNWDWVIGPKWAPKAGRGRTSPGVLAGRKKKKSGDLTGKKRKAAARPPKKPKAPKANDATTAPATRANRRALSGAQAVRSPIQVPRCTRSSRN